MVDNLEQLRATSIPHALVVKQCEKTTVRDDPVAEAPEIFPGPAKNPAARRVSPV